VFTKGTDLWTSSLRTKNRAFIHGVHNCGVFYRPNKEYSPVSKGPKRTESHVSMIALFVTLPAIREISLWGLWGFRVQFPMARADHIAVSWRALSKAHAWSPERIYGAEAERSCAFIFTQSLFANYHYRGCSLIIITIRTISREVPNQKKRSPQGFSSSVVPKCKPKCIPPCSTRVTSPTCPPTRCTPAPQKVRFGCYDGSTVQFPTSLPDNFVTRAFGEKKPLIMTVHIANQVLWRVPHSKTAHNDWRKCLKRF